MQTYLTARYGINKMVLHGLMLLQFEYIEKLRNRISPSTIDSNASTYRIQFPTTSLTPCDIFWILLNTKNSNILFYKLYYNNDDDELMIDTLAMLYKNVTYV